MKIIALFSKNDDSDGVKVGTSSSCMIQAGLNELCEAQWGDEFCHVCDNRSAFDFLIISSISMIYFFTQDFFQHYPRLFSSNEFIVLSLFHLHLFFLLSKTFGRQQL